MTKDIAALVAGILLWGVLGAAFGYIDMRVIPALVPFDGGGSSGLFAYAIVRDSVLYISVGVVVGALSARRWPGYLLGFLFGVLVLANGVDMVSLVTAMYVIVVVWVSASAAWFARKNRCKEA